MGHAPVTPPTAQGRAPETPPKVAPVRHEALAADARQVEKSGWWQHVVDSSEPHIQPQPPLQADLDMAAGETDDAEGEMLTRMKQIITTGLLVECKHLVIDALD